VGTETVGFLTRSMNPSSILDHYRVRAERGVGIFIATDDLWINLNKFSDLAESSL
jgi:hypothetical protein